jgi:hypothetical protein
VWQAGRLEVVVALRVPDAARRLAVLRVMARRLPLCCGARGERGRREEGTDRRTDGGGRGRKGDMTRIERDDVAWLTWHGGVLLYRHH